MSRPGPKTKAAERAGLQGEGGDLRLAQHQRHRPGRGQALGARQAHPDAAPTWPGWDKREGNVTEVIYTPSSPTRRAWPRCCRATWTCVTDLPTQDVRRASRKDPKLKVLDGAEKPHHFIGMHQQQRAEISDVKGKNPFKDVRVRRALNMAVDREAIQARDHARPVDSRRPIMVAPSVHGPGRRHRQGRARQTPTARASCSPRPATRTASVTARLPEQPLRQRRGDLPGAGRHVGAHRPQGEAARADRCRSFIAKIQNFDPRAYMLGWGVATFDAPTSLQRSLRTKTTGADGSLQPRAHQLDPQARPTDRRDEDRDRREEARRMHPRRAGDRHATSTTTCRCTTSCGRGR